MRRSRPVPQVLSGFRHGLAAHSAADRVIHHQFSKSARCLIQHFHRRANGLVIVAVLQLLQLSF